MLIPLCIWTVRPVDDWQDAASDHRIVPPDEPGQGANDILTGKEAQENRLPDRERARRMGLVRSAAKRCFEPRHDGFEERVFHQVKEDVPRAGSRILQRALHLCFSGDLLTGLIFKHGDEAV